MKNGQKYSAHSVDLRFNINTFRQQLAGQVLAHLLGTVQKATLVCTLDIA